MTLTPEQLAKSKEEFEASVKALPGFIDEILNIHDGRYSYSGTEFMWKGWIARQESLVVELPKRGKGFYNDDMVDIDDVIESLQSAGINYREKE